MKKRIVVLAAVLFASPVFAQDMKLVPALPRPGATQILDNARGRVWDVIYPPGMPTGLHRHPSDFVGVELVDTMLKVTRPDGKASTNPIRRGTIYMLRQGLTHIEESVVGQPQRNSILIELKGERPDGKPAAPGFTAGKKVTDNERVMLWDASWTAGQPAQPFAQTHDIFLVPIDAGVLEITAPGETRRTLPLSGGMVVFLPAGAQRSIRSTQGTVRAAVVELK